MKDQPVRKWKQNCRGKMKDVVSVLCTQNNHTIKYSAIKNFGEDEDD